MTWMAANYLGFGGAGDRMASFYFPFRDSDDAGFRPYESGLAKRWIRERANKLLDEKLEDLISAVRSAGPRSKRKRKITAAGHRLEDIRDIITSDAPSSVADSLIEIDFALSEALSASAEFSDLKAEIIRHARHIQSVARSDRRKRNNMLKAMLLS